MSFNTFGRLFTFTSFGESHGKALGVVIDGFPSRIKVDEELLEEALTRRQGGLSTLTTQRKEEEKYEILSGVFSGYTTGSPIAVVVYNSAQKSSDYSNLEHTFRPGHADYTYEEKYGIRDYRGGGRSSGRETIARVIAGAFAKMALKEYGISVDAAVVSIGKIKATDYLWTPPFSAPLYAPQCREYSAMIEEIESARKDGDSIGSTVECRIKGVPVGLGDPAFEKMDALLSSAIFSLGGVKAFESGSGFASSSKRGSENNDSMRIKDGRVSFSTNNAGGILGGISNGDDIIFKAYFKPTPSISKEQKTITDTKEETTLVINGRHDPVIGIRACVVVEAMASAVILDSLLIRRAYL